MTLQVPFVQTVQDTVWRFRRCSSARWDVTVFLQRQFQLSPRQLEGASDQAIDKFAECF